MMKATPLSRSSLDNTIVTFASYDVRLAMSECDSSSTSLLNAKSRMIFAATKSRMHPTVMLMPGRFTTACIHDTHVYI